MISEGSCVKRWGNEAERESTSKHYFNITNR